MNTKTTVAVLLVLSLTAGALLWRSRLAHRETLAPKRGNIVESIYGLGTVTADQVFSVRVGVPLSVQKIFVHEGDTVAPGTALVRLDENVMRSPIQGTVTNVAYKDGELVSPQMPIVTVTNLERLYLEVSLEQQLVLRIQKGQNASVSFESLRGEKFKGTVVSIYPRDNQFIVRIEMSHWPQGVLPGMTADVALLVGEKSEALLIPIRSIVAGRVTRFREGKKETVAVKLGVVNGEWAEVLSGDILVTDRLLVRK